MLGSNNLFSILNDFFLTIHNVYYTLNVAVSIIITETIIKMYRIISSKQICSSNQSAENFN